MRVGVDLLFIQPGRNRGTETYVHGLLGSLGGRAGLELELFTNEVNHGHFQGIAGSRVRKCAVSGVNRTWRVIYQQLVVPRLAKAAGCELLFCPGYLAPLRSRVPIVVTVPDTQFLDVPTSVAAGQLAAYRAIVPGGSRRAAAVITISEFSKRRIVEALMVNPDRVFVTHLAPKGFAGGGLSEDQERAFVARHGLSRPYFLSVSNRYPHKNIPGLIKSFIAFKEQTGSDIDLVLVGSSLSLAENGIGIEKRSDIRFLGFVSDAELEISYRRAHGFVLASLYEGFGLPVLEAMANGVPVACSNVASLPEVVGAAAVLFDPASTSAISAALQVLHSNRERRELLIREGQKNLTRFSWRQCADQTLAVFRGCAARKLANP